METFSAALGLVLSLLSVAAAFDSFSDIGLLPKLIVTAIATGLVGFGAASRATRYIHPAGGGFGLAAPERSIGRFVLCSLVLAVLCALFVWLAVYLTQRFTLQLQETSKPNSSATLLIAPEGIVQSVTIELPPKKGSTCDWHNRSQEPIPPLTAFTVGFDSPTPSLQIDNFIHPQRIEVDCTPPHTLRIDLPGRTVLYPPGTLWTIRFVILIVGGLIWLTTCFAMWLWSA